MKTKRTMLPIICVLPLLGSCASYQDAGNAAWTVKPMISVKHSTEKPEALYQLGRYYQGQERYEQAISAYQKSLVADPAYAEARNGLGVIYSLLGRYAEAIEQFGMAIRQAPAAAHIRNNLGYALYLQGLYVEAATELKQAVKLDPSDQQAYNNLGLALDKAGEKVKAVQAFTQAANLKNAEEAVTVATTQADALVPSKDATVRAGTAGAMPSPDSGLSLQLPKDKGILRQASPQQVPVVASQVQAVQLTPGVYELRDGRAERAVAPLAGGANPVNKFRLEVSNGNGVTGMAKMVAGFLREQGYEKARLTNQKTFAVSSSRIRYRQGYQDEARLLMEKMPGQTDLLQTEDMRMGISVQIVLGKDMAGSLAHFGRDGKKVKLARAGSDS
jgi:tetratricopeptide (TPR) repeat protein